MDTGYKFNFNNDLKRNLFISKGAIIKANLPDGNVIEIEVLDQGLFVGYEDGAQMSITPAMRNGCIISKKTDK